jgi:stage V sporulation protein B
VSPGGHPATKEGADGGSEAGRGPLPVGTVGGGATAGGPDPAGRTAEAVAASPGLARDVALLAGVRLGAVGAGFLTSVLAARVLGTTELGAAAVGLTTGIIAALLANGGLNISSIYFLGRRPAERGAITHRSFTLGLGAMSLAALLVLAFARIAAPDAFTAERTDLVIAAAALAASIVAFELFGALLLGHDRRTAYLVVQAIEGVGSFAVVAAVFLAGGATAAGYVLGSAIAAFVAALFAIVVVQRIVGGRPLAYSAAFTREALALGLRGQVGNVLQMLNLRLDLLLVPVLLTLDAAGVYVIAVRMSEVVAQIASAAAAYLFPAVSRSAATHTALTERTVRVTLVIIVAVGIVIAALAPVLLTLFFGPAYAAGTDALRITMIAMVPLAVTRLMASDMKGRGRPGLVSVSAAGALAATVAFALLLIPAYGIVGAAAASVIAYSAGAAVLLVAYRRVTGSPLGRLVPTGRDVREIAGGFGAALARIRRPRGRDA